MYFAARANVNTGVIVTIWSVNPLFMAIADYIMFKQKLQWFHSVGMLMIVICVIFISMSNKGEASLPSVPGQA